MFGKQIKMLKKTVIKTIEGGGKNIYRDMNCPVYPREHNKEGNTQSKLPRSLTNMQPCTLLNKVCVNGQYKPH